MLCWRVQSKIFYKATQRSRLQTRKFGNISCYPYPHFFLITYNISTKLFIRIHLQLFLYLLSIFQPFYLKDLIVQPVVFRTLAHGHAHRTFPTTSTAYTIWNRRVTHLATIWHSLPTSSFLSHRGMRLMFLLSCCSEQGEVPISDIYGTFLDIFAGL